MISDPLATFVQQARVCGWLWAAVLGLWLAKQVAAVGYLWWLYYALPWIEFAQDVVAG